MSDIPHYISLGAGVQSSTLALMAAGGEITPMPKGAIFADTKAEPKAVYEWLDWLEKRLPFPIHRVEKGDLRSDSLETRISKKGVEHFKVALPFFTRDNHDGSKSRISTRECTRNYKIRPILKKVRQLERIGRSKEHGVRVIQWLGISVDELYRMKPSQVPWAEVRWPLIEKRMDRRACLNWMEDHGYPLPPRSACVFCPFRRNEEWRHLKMTDPDGFADAVAYEKEIQAIRSRSPDSSSMPFLHQSLVPLDQIDFRNDEDRGQMTFGWDDECTGMCGV